MAPLREFKGFIREHQSKYFINYRISSIVRPNNLTQVNSPYLKGLTLFSEYSQPRCIKAMPPKTITVIIEQEVSR